MSTRARLARFGIAIIALTGSGVISQSFGSAANGIPLGSGSNGTLSPRLVDPVTSAQANPTSTPWSGASTINVTSQSSGTVTYTVDASSTPDPSGCLISDTSNTSATISATEADTCVIDVSVDGDLVYNPSNTQATVSFTPADATTSALATPDSTSWPNASTLDVTTNSTGSVTYSTDASSAAAGCAASPSGAASASVTATGVGNCVIDVNVAGDANYLASTTQAAVNFTPAGATTSALASPTSISWSHASTIDVTTNSTGLVTYTTDPSSTAAGCAASPSSAASATVLANGSGSCVIDLNVAGDSNYLASSAQATVSFTPAPATTSASATPTSTPWSNTSTINVTTDSTGLVTYGVDAASTAQGCAVDPSATVSATGAGTCVIDVNVAGDANYLPSTAQASVSFTTPTGGGGGGGGGPATLTQTSPTTGTVSTAASGTFTAGPVTVQGNSGTVTFVVTKSSPSLSVSSTGLISTTGVLSGGTYSISGTDSDSHGESGTWTYSLKVVATVTFSANGGVGTMSPENASAPTALTLNAFVRKGYTFVGWNTSSQGTGVSYTNGAVFPFASTTSLFAVWKVGALPFRTVRFEANGGLGHTSSQVENAPTALKGSTFTRPGYVFVAWSTTAEGTGRSYEPGSTYAFKNSLTLFARWKKVVSKAPTPPKPPKHKVPSRAVTFYANGGTGKMAAEVKRRPTALTSEDFRRSGYTFIDWNTKPDGKGTTYANRATYPFKSSARLYAQWKSNIPVPQPIARGIIVGPFALGSASLSPGMETQIQNLATEAKTRGASQVVLYGCGDQVGSTSAASVALARSRAGAVATYLGPRLSDEGLKGWTISITDTPPSPSEVGSVVATLG